MQNTLTLKWKWIWRRLRSTHLTCNLPVSAAGLARDEYCCCALVSVLFLLRVNTVGLAPWSSCRIAVSLCELPFGDNSSNRFSKESRNSSSLQLDSEQFIWAWKRQRSEIIHKLIWHEKKSIHTKAGCEIKKNYWVSFRKATTENWVSEAILGFPNGNGESLLSMTLIFTGFPVGNHCQKLGFPTVFWVSRIAGNQVISHPAIRMKMSKTQCFISKYSEWWINFLMNSFFQKSSLIVPKGMWFGFEWHMLLWFNR